MKRRMGFIYSYQLNPSIIIHIKCEKGKINMTGNKNTWGLIFNCINEEKDEIVELLGLNLGSESEARLYFDKIKTEFPSEDDLCIIDLVDEEDSIVDDYPISKEQVLEIAARFGHEIAIN
jgi:hypothetical protein